MKIKIKFEYHYPETRVVEFTSEVYNHGVEDKYNWYEYLHSDGNKYEMRLEERDRVHGNTYRWNFIGSSIKGDDPNSTGVTTVEIIP